MLRRLHHLLLQEWFILVALSLTVTLILISTFVKPSPTYRVGDVADHNIKAKFELLIEDDQSTQKKREEAAQESPLVFDLDSSVGVGIAQRLNAAFEVQRQQLEKHVDAFGANAAKYKAIGGGVIEDFRNGAARSGIHETSSGPDLPGLLQFKLEHRSVFEQALGFEVSDAIYDTIERQEFEYDRQGVVNFLVLLNIYNGHIRSCCLDKNDSEHLCRALPRLLQPFPSFRRLHLIWDGGPSRTSVATLSFLKSYYGEWLRILFTPAHASWLNQAELLLKSFDLRYLPRGNWTSRQHLIDHLYASTPEYNRLWAQPINWSWTRRDLHDWAAKKLSELC